MGDCKGEMKASFNWVAKRIDSAKAIVKSKTNSRSSSRFFTSTLFSILLKPSKLTALYLLGISNGLRVFSAIS